MEKSKFTYPVYGIEFELGRVLQARGPPTMSQLLRGLADVTFGSNSWSLRTRKVMIDDPRPTVIDVIRDLILQVQASS
jgi:hypothetical protein